MDPHPREMSWSSHYLHERDDGPENCVEEGGRQALYVAQEREQRQLSSIEGRLESVTVKADVDLKNQVQQEFIG